MKRKSKILYLSSNERNVEKKVSTELEEKGVVVVENFITQKQCDELMMLCKEKQLENSNELTFVHVKDAKFFSNALGSSKAAFDLVTSKLARNIAESYLGKNFRLKCHRAYELNKSYHFPWHTDNKYDKNKNEESGIVLIVYLSDTEEGATEFILGSHKFSNNFSKNNFSKAYIKDNYSDLLAKANGKAGSAVISDIRVIHRGGLSKKMNRRSSFWFQIHSNMNHAERLLINPEYLPKNVSEDLASYLGFSRKFGLDVHPVTTNKGSYLPANLILRRLFKYLFLTLLIPIYYLKIITPEAIKIRIVSIFKKSNDWKN